MAVFTQETEKNSAPMRLVTFSVYVRFLQVDMKNKSYLCIILVHRALRPLI